MTNKIVVVSNKLVTNELFEFSLKKIDLTNRSGCASMSYEQQVLGLKRLL